MGRGFLGVDFGKASSEWLVRKKLGLAATLFLGDNVRRPGCGTSCGCEKDGLLGGSHCGSCIMYDGIDARTIRRRGSRHSGNTC